MEIPTEKKILFKFFEGKHTSFEGKMIEEWLQKDVNKERYFHYLNEWEAANPQLTVDVEAALASLSRKIESKAIASTDSTATSSQHRQWGLVAKIAAGIAFLFFTVSYYLTKFNESPENLTAYDKNVQQLKFTSGEIFEKQNVGNQPLLVNLPDGSSVLLQPSAKISYNPKTFGISRREVILGGEAFFEVYKDARSPFIVYANDLIAKVLGTSFTIKASTKTNKAEVIVKSGRVAVFTQKDSQKIEKTAAKELQGLVLVENEKVAVNNTNETTLKPEKMQKSDFSAEIETLNFNFDDANANDVFTTLERAYNIDIVYDKNSFSKARLTAHLGDEPLSEKLKLICLALEVSYRDVDDKIIILE